MRQTHNRNLEKISDCGRPNRINFNAMKRQYSFSTVWLKKKRHDTTKWCSLDRICIGKCDQKPGKIKIFPGDYRMCAAKGPNDTWAMRVCRKILTVLYIGVMFTEFY